MDFKKNKGREFGGVWVFDFLPFSQSDPSTFRAYSMEVAKKKYFLQKSACWPAGVITPCNIENSMVYPQEICLKYT